MTFGVRGTFRSRSHLDSTGPGGPERAVREEVELGTAQPSRLRQEQPAQEEDG